MPILKCKIYICGYTDLSAPPEHQFRCSITLTKAGSHDCRRRAPARRPVGRSKPPKMTDTTRGFRSLYLVHQSLHQMHKNAKPNSPPSSMATATTPLLSSTLQPVTHLLRPASTSVQRRHFHPSQQHPPADPVAMLQQLRLPQPRSSPTAHEGEQPVTSHRRCPSRGPSYPASASSSTARRQIQPPSAFAHHTSASSIAHEHHAHHVGHPPAFRPSQQHRPPHQRPRFINTPDSDLAEHLPSSPNPSRT
ncbi:hypothetical protein ACLOJK_028761 [Asimina triloba]